MHVIVQCKVPATRNARRRKWVAKLAFRLARALIKKGIGFSTLNRKALYLINFTTYEGVIAFQDDKKH